MKNQLSFLGKVWKEAPQISDMEHLWETLLKNRGLETPEAISQFCAPELKHLQDPFGIAGMDRAVDRIWKAIEQAERIMIFGDFDTDGITSTVILVDGLKRLGASVSYRIPERNKDSHGLKHHFLDEIASQSVGLVITCDCGINDQQEVAYAKQIGLDIIISDHHDPEEGGFPADAVAVLNPKRADCPYPEKNLSGAGVAFKILSALLTRKWKEASERASFLEKYLDVCAIGLVADCVPLVGENRVLTKFGLEQMKHTSWEGLQQLLEYSGVDSENIESDTIGFTVAPRLNAASRIGNVLKASSLFLGESSGHAARLSYLEALNEERKSLTEAAVGEALSQVEPGASCQFLVSEDWLPGVLGLIGSRLVEMLNVPIIAVQMRKQAGQKILAASCRAPEGASIGAALQAMDETLFFNRGGHDGAGGFLAPAENLPAIKEALRNHFSNTPVLAPLLKPEAFLSTHLLDFELSEFLKTLSPFGMGNKAPIFGLEDVEIQGIRMMGKDKSHIRISVLAEGQTLDLVGFFMASLQNKIQRGDKRTVLFTVSENVWKGVKRLQFYLVDMK